MTYVQKRRRPHSCRPSQVQESCTRWPMPVPKAVCFSAPVTRPDRQNLHRPGKTGSGADAQTTSDSLTPSHGTSSTSTAKGKREKTLIYNATTTQLADWFVL